MVWGGDKGLLDSVDTFSAVLEILCNAWELVRVYNGNIIIITILLSQRNKKKVDKKTKQMISPFTSHSFSTSQSGQGLQTKGTPQMKLSK